MSTVKVAFLYSEVAGYFLSCVEELSKRAEVLVVRWPVNKEAPFDLEKFKSVQIVDKSTFSPDDLNQFVHDFNPDLIVCSGWMDKEYLKIAKSFNKSIPVVLALDNHWTGSLKQRIAASVSNIYLKPTFSHAWVPGKPQAEYARKLGFKTEKIFQNYYCADTKLFKGIYDRTIEQKRLQFPKRFLYVARYVEHKGIFEMWEAFIQLQKENPNDWELWCIGTGDQWGNRVEHDKIKHFGFVQPEELEKYIKDSGVYILPSKFEPWGVSVQEFAISGFPLLLSEEVGAKWTYLKNNGYSFKSGSVQEIKDVMNRLVRFSDSELIDLAETSHQLGMSFTTEMWADTALKIIREWKN